VVVSVPFERDVMLPEASKVNAQAVAVPSIAVTSLRMSWFRWFTPTTPSQASAAEARAPWVRVNESVEMEAMRLPAGRSACSTRSPTESLSMSVPGTSVTVTLDAERVPVTPNRRVSRALPTATIAASEASSVALSLTPNAPVPMLATVVPEGSAAWTTSIPTASFARSASDTRVTVGLPSVSVPVTLAEIVVALSVMFPFES
jgi:hypothetical protein